MATNLAIDDRLIEDAKRIGGHKTKKEAVTAASERVRAAARAARDPGLGGKAGIPPGLQLQAVAQGQAPVMVLVDTSVWSLALRRKPEHLSPREQLLVAEWSELVREGRVQMIGPIRQELLSDFATSSSSHSWKSGCQSSRIRRSRLRTTSKPPGFSIFCKREESPGLPSTC